MKNARAKIVERRERLQKEKEERRKRGKGSKRESKEQKRMERQRKKDELFAAQQQVEGSDDNGDGGGVSSAREVMESSPPDDNKKQGAKKPPKRAWNADTVWPKGWERNTSEGNAPYQYWQKTNGSTARLRKFSEFLGSALADAEKSGDGALEKWLQKHDIQKDHQDYIDAVEYKERTKTAVLKFNLTPEQWQKLWYPSEHYSYGGAKNYIARGKSYVTQVDFCSVMLEESEEMFEKWRSLAGIPKNAEMVKEAWDIKNGLRTRNADGGRSVKKKEGWQKKKHEKFKSGAGLYTRDQSIRDLCPEGYEIILVRS